MTNKITLFIAFFAFLQALPAQKLPVDALTIFKNGNAMVERSGKVSTANGVYTTRELPDALFGTFWIGTAENALKTVFTQLDSVAVPGKNRSMAAYYKMLSGKKAKIYLASGADGSLATYEGQFGTIEVEDQSGYAYIITFKTKEGTWLTFLHSEMRRVELQDEPVMKQDLSYEMKKRMDISFNDKNKEQPLSLTYLTNGLGWTPVYRLELDGKDKARLSLRAEVVNDAEDFGSGAELRLAVGNPNFMFANKLSNLVNFSAEGFNQFINNNVGRSNLFANSQMAYDVETYEERVVFTPAASAPDGSQAEDFFFYKVKADQLPKGSRYQFPVFDTDLATTHYFECRLPDGGTNIGRYNGPQDAKSNPVTHYIEFKNTTTYPWTTGVANLFSGSELQPLSQDKVPYTAPGATGRVRIAETPEIKVTQSEGDLKREENVQKYFNRVYDRITIEGQLCVINYKTEPVVIKIKRKIEGQPTLSPDQKWTLHQEDATLRVNPSYEVEWELTLKPGEERKWKYQFEVFVDL